MLTLMTASLSFGMGIHCRDGIRLSGSLMRASVGLIYGQVCGLCVR